MLTIRTAQLRKLEGDLLYRWIIEALRRDHAAALQRLSPQEQHDLALEGITRGRAFGLQLPEDQLAYTRILLLLGRDWQERPDAAWAKDFLDDWDPDRGARVVRLEQALRALCQTVAHITPAQTST